MSLALDYDSEKNILYITVIDNLSLNELDVLLKKIAGSKDYRENVGILLDTSSLNVPIGDMDFNLNVTEIRNRLIKRKGAKTAIVTSSDFTLGMGGKYEMLADGVPENVMVFDNFMEGEIWLIGEK